MNKIEKFLKSLPPKEFNLLEIVFMRIKTREWRGLNIKKLRGYKIYYRARISRFRIIFSKNESGIEIIDVDRRDDNTYKQF